jgi:regulator of sigma E protease
VFGLLFNPVTLIIFGLMLGILIFVHELGHFLVAKRLGVPVYEFGFGFPPRAWRFWKSAGWIEIQSRRLIITPDFKLPEKLHVGSRVVYKSRVDDKGRDVLASLELIDPESQATTPSSLVQAFEPGTEYTLNWIPLGGFVRLAGEDDPMVPGGFQAAKPWVRAPILLAGVTMNFILAYLVFSLVSFMTPPFRAIPTTYINSVQKDFPAMQAGLLPNDQIVSVNGENVRDNPDALVKNLRDKGGQKVTLTINRDGTVLPPITVVPRLVPERPNQAIIGIGLGLTGFRVLSVAPGSAADRAGIQAGDAVAFLIGSQTLTPKEPSELTQFVLAHPGTKLPFYLVRDEKLVDGTVKELEIPSSVSDAQATLGLNLGKEPWEPLTEGAQTMVRIMESVPMLVAQISRAGLPDNSFVGPIGIYQATGEIAQRGGPIELIGWLGLLSLNLAIVNLFPIPPLDGGHLLFTLLEWVRRGKRIDLKKQRLISEICIIVLLGLMVVISFSDVQRLFSGRSILP